LDEFRDSGLEELDKIKQMKVIELVELKEGSIPKKLHDSRIYDEVKDFTLEDIMQDSTKRTKMIGYPGRKFAYKAPEDSETYEPESTDREVFSSEKKQIPLLPAHRYPTNLGGIAQQFSAKRKSGLMKNVPKLKVQDGKVILYSETPKTGEKGGRIKFILPTSTKQKKAHLENLYSSVKYYPKSGKFIKEGNKMQSGTVILEEKDIKNILEEDHYAYEVLFSKIIVALGDNFLREIYGNDDPLTDYEEEIVLKFAEKEEEIDETEHVYPNMEIKYDVYSQSRTISTFNVNPFLTISDKTRRKPSSGLLSSSEIDDIYYDILYPDLEEHQRKGKKLHQNAVDYFNRTKSILDSGKPQEKKEYEASWEAKYGGDEGISLEEVRDLAEEVEKRKGQHQSPTPDEEEEKKEYGHDPKLGDTLNEIISEYMDVEDDIGGAH
jgi:hypothetical protein